MEIEAFEERVTLAHRVQAREELAVLLADLSPHRPLSWLVVGSGDVNSFFSNDRSEEGSMSVYLIQSFLNGDYIDVLGGAGTARAQLCLNPSNISLPNTWAPSQLWTLQPPVDERFPGFPYPDPFPNSFYIVSQLPVDASTQLPWVVDIRGRSTTAPAPVQLYPQKPSVVRVDRKTPLGPISSWTFNSGVENQLWTVAPGGANRFRIFFIQSVLDPNLVIEVTGSNTKAGTLLQVNTKASGATPWNQLWTLGWL